jgi:tetratricopeptide (TPR) repeat protein
MLGIVLKRQNRFDESARWYERACELSGRHPLFEAWRASALRLAGAEAEADAILRTLREHEDDPRVDSVARAVIAAAERDFDAALGHLHEAADRRLPLIFWCLRAVWCEGEFPKDHAGVEALWQRIWPGDTPRASAARRGPTPLVGREKERAALHRMLDEAASGRGGLVLLGGEPGVGKTRLATETLEDGRERGMLAVTGHAYEEEIAPFVLASEILDEMVRLVPKDRMRTLLGDDASELSRLLPDLRKHFADIPAPEELPPEQQQRVLFRSFVDLLERTSAGTPIVMLLDDVHWADESSLKLLEQVAQRLGELPIAVIGTYRDAETEMGEAFTRTLADLVRRRQVERLTIKSFDRQAVGDLLAARGGSAPPKALVAAIHQGTEGNAFFVEEVFRHLSEEGVLFDEEGRWRDDLDAATLDVPEGVRLVTRRRLERLGENTGAVLTTAAAIGLRFELGVLEVAVGDADRALKGVEQAEAAQLILSSAGRREARYEFAHALVRQTLLEELSVPRRQRLHLAIADAMEAAWGEHAADRAAEIAHQLEEAGTRAAPERTRRFLTLAGARALAAAAADEARTYYDRALALTDDLGEAERAELLFERGNAERGAGDWVAAATDWGAALPGLETAKKTDLVTLACWQLAYFGTWRNTLDEAAGFAKRGLASAGDGPSVARCRLFAILGHIKGMAGVNDEADRLIGQAITMAEALGDERLLGAEVLYSRLYQYENTAQVSKLLEAGERAIELTRRSGRPWDVSNAIGATLMTLGWNGQFARGREQADAIDSLAVQQGDTGTILHGWFARAQDALSRGDLREARECARRSTQITRDAGFPWFSIALSMEGAIATLAGDWTDAREAVEEAVRFKGAGNYGGIEEACLLRFLTYAGEPGALELLDALEPRLPRSGVINGNGSWTVLLEWVEAAVLLGQHERAARLYPLTLQLIAQGTVALWACGLTERVAGIAAAAGKQWAEAEAHFTDAMRQAEELPHFPEQAEVRYWHARMLLYRHEPGDLDRAEVLLHEAAEVCRRIGMPKYLEMVQAMLGELRAARRGAAAGTPAH